VKRHWTIDPEVTFLNHGSFGACPRAVQELQAELRAEIERNTMAFFARGLEARLDSAREALAEFVGAPPGELAFVSNASTGSSTVLRSLPFEADDEILLTDHAYNAVRTTVDHVITRSGAKAVVASVPFPLGSPDQVVDAVLARVSPKTKLAVLDHVTSATGLVLPIERLVRELEERGIDVLVDGAHAPGMLDLNLTALGAAYYTGNCHKWLCAPKGAAFLHVRADRAKGIHPLVVSHGANVPRTDRSRFRLEFDWTGTWDPTPYLCVPRAIETVGALLPGGWGEVRERNHALALEARTILCSALGVDAPAPDSMLGSLAAVELPSCPALLPAEFCLETPFQRRLREEHRFEIALPVFPARPSYLLRVSAQLYTERADFERLATTVAELVS
jgi:isopenicillin-N epimerase